MTHVQHAVLRYAYHQYRQDITIHNIPFCKLEISAAEARSALDALQESGYLEVTSFAIGCAVIRLTDYGISYCEQTY